MRKPRKRADEQRRIGPSQEPHAGAALLSLGAACWWARHEERSAASRALVSAMLIYNTAVVTLGIVGALGALGPLQWAAVVPHGAQAIWCAWVVADRRR